MDNKDSSCPACRLKKSSRLIILALFVVALGAFGITFIAKEESGTAPENLDAVSPETALPFSLDPAKVAEAELIPTAVQSVDLAHIDGRDYRTLILVPDVEWQGDFTAERIARTLVDAAKAHLGAVDVVNVYLLPCKIQSEVMFDRVALGKLTADLSGEDTSSLWVQTRGYLPQELKFMTLWDQRWPEFVKGDDESYRDGLDREALSKAVIEEMGPDAYGMSYPFQVAKEVVNVVEVLKALGVK